MSADTVTKDDLRDLRDQVLERMDVGFSGVYARQDKTNGQVVELKVVTAKHDVQLQSLALAQQAFGRRARSGEVAARATIISRRDVMMFVAGGTALGALLQGAIWLFQHLKLG